MTLSASVSEEEITKRRRLLSQMIALAHLIPLSIAMGVALSFYRESPLGIVAGAGLSLFLALRIRRLRAAWRSLDAVANQPREN